MGDIFSIWFPLTHDLSWLFLGHPIPLFQIQDRIKGPLKTIICPALAGVVQLIERYPVYLRVTNSIASQSTCPGCEFNPKLGCMPEADQYFSLFLSL